MFIGAYMSVFMHLVLKIQTHKDFSYKGSSHSSFFDVIVIKIDTCLY